MYLLPLEGVRGEEPSLREGLGGSLFPLFQFLHKLIDSCELLRDVDVLRTMRITLTAVYAMVCLTKRRDRAVVADEVYATSLFIVRCLFALWHVTLIHAFIVVVKDARDVNTVRAWHTVFTIVARHGWIADDKICRLALKPVNLILCQWL